MGRRPYTEIIRCTTAGCDYASVAEYNTRASRAADSDRLRAFKCVRHRAPDTVLSRERPSIETTLMVAPSSRASGLYWLGLDGKLRSGFVHGPGFQAHAGDFPEGTALHISVSVVLPEGCPTPPAPGGEE